MNLIDTTAVSFTIFYTLYWKSDLENRIAYG